MDEDSKIPSTNPGGPSGRGGRVCVGDTLYTDLWRSNPLGGRRGMSNGMGLSPATALRMRGDMAGPMPREENKDFASEVVCSRPSPH